MRARGAVTVLAFHETATEKGERGFYLARVIRIDDYPAEF